MKSIIAALSLVVRVRRPRAGAERQRQRIDDVGGSRRPVSVPPGAGRRIASRAPPTCRARRISSDPNNPVNKEDAALDKPRSRASAAAAEADGCAGRARQLTPPAIVHLGGDARGGPRAGCAALRISTASASCSSTAAVVAQSMQPSVMLWP